MADRAHVEPYPHQLAGHCGSGAMRDLLDWAQLHYDDVPLGEGMVFGLSGALGFSYLRAPGLGSPFYLVGRGPELTTQLCARLGIRVEVRATDDPAEGWSWVRDELDAGRPLLCWADMRELPYLNVRMRMSRHDIVVIGYDDPAHTVTVVDNDRSDPQTITHADLARARSSTSFPMPTRHTCYPMRFPDQLPPLQATAAEACAAAANAMLDQNGGPAVTAGADVETVHGSGLAGVQIFVDDLQRWPDAFDDATLDQALRTLAVFIEKAGTGGSLFRRLQAEFLTDLTRGLGATASPAADAYTAISEQWSRIATTALADDPPRIRLGTIRSLAESLPGLETLGVRRLREAAEALG
ncbi:BtrH N-terminal domain-containing protein [Pseudonocardia bannensis]|uniref:BtrH N-terminal domain-containing protein n=1 Tax=Pseudonocardia bannensis TaxID=630973 RepID=A0A848DEK1_9PSEU|nr:BtrH N-terminal domain-containing protein [Pseudonocardia bannensis]NMH91050.1 BtrH N-terminal domain-containing protein [Pseudonocardia bannensis]